jgi:CRISPR/Cas system-associated exonuclease Cas4 (RecB family)
MLRLRASEAQRIALCPGSARAAFGIEGPPSEYAERGTRIHLWLANKFGVQKGENPVLTDEEQEVAEKLAEKTREFILSRNFVGPLKMWTEMEIKGDGWSGHIDLVVESADETIIVDWKTGWGDQVSPDLNAQLRAYVVLLDVAPCVAVIIQPSGRPEPVEYSRGDLEVAKAELAEIREQALSPTASRIPHPVACQYCPAFGRATCPETCTCLQTAEILQEVKELSALTPEFLGSLGSLAKLAEKRIEQVKEEIRARLEVGLEVPGCSIGKASETKEIADIGKAFELLGMLTQEQFLAACTASIPKLADALYACLNQTEKVSKAAARQELEALLATVIETKTRRGNLKIGGIE